jgi:hypothetical protein
MISDAELQGLQKREQEEGFDYEDIKKMIRIQKSIAK